MIIQSPPEAAPVLLRLLARGLDLVLLDPPQRRGTREVGVRAHTDAALTAVTPGRAEAAGAGGSLAQPHLPGAGGKVGPELLQHRLLGSSRANISLHCWRLADLPRRHELAGEFLRRTASN